MTDTNFPKATAGVAAAPMPAALTQRLDAIDAAFGEATNAVHALADRLEPVLPQGFGNRALPSTPPVERPEDMSPLAVRLDELATRGQGLIYRLRVVLESVDL